MAIVWEVNNCDYTVSLGGEANVITKIRYTVSETETVDDIEHSASANGVAVVDTSDLSGFIAYGSVTEVNAIAWAKAALGSDLVTHIETGVTRRLTESKTPTTGSGKPW